MNEAQPDSESPIADGHAAGGGEAGWGERWGEAGERLRKALWGRTWTRLHVRLENSRNTAAKEPPLSVCRAVLYHAWREGGLDPNVRTFVFHPQALPLPERVRKGAAYALEILFPQADPGVAGAFCDGLRRHLARREANFVLAGEPVVSPGSLGALEAEWLPRLDSGAQELCLDFLTPLRWNWKAAAGNEEASALPWRLGAGEFLALVQRRLHALTHPDDWPEAAPAVDGALEAARRGGLRLLPYFWEFRRYSHTPKTHRQQGGSHREDWLGMEGPLYLRGGWAPMLPALLLLSAWHMGQKADQPQGRFLPKTGRTFFDRLLPDPAHLRGTDQRLREEADGTEALWCGLEEREGALADLAAVVAGGCYVPEPAQAFTIPKPGLPPAERRLLAEISPVDALVQKTVAKLLQPRVDRMLEEASHAWRPGRGVESARRLVVEKIREGHSLVLESDIETFFDDIPWSRLEEVLAAHLPEADGVTRGLLMAVARQPLQRDGVMVDRTQGLLQGGPLSPLLANLFLDPFDEAMMARGRALVRYGDDFIILVRDAEDAEAALRDCREVLAALGLDLKDDKTSITPVDAGFRFLGLDLGQDLSEAFVEKSALRKTLFVDTPFSFLGLDGDTVTVKKDRRLLHRVPLLRISDVIALGPVSLSSHLIAAAARRGIPITFSGPTGYAVNTFHPDSQAHFALSGHHLRRWEETSPLDRTGLAALFVAAKIQNFLAWTDELPPGTLPAETRRALNALLAALPGCESTEAVRGCEGQAAKLLFPVVHGLLRVEGFAAAGRVPRHKPDPYNALIDFASFLLFTRLNCLLRSQGLNPYLGFLHSAADHYESLVCDLQEPFRARMERLVLKVINRRILTATDFELDPDGRHHLRGAKAGRFVEEFEKEMQTRRSADPGTWRQLITAQVEAIRDWVDHPATPLRVYRATLRKDRFRKE